jgi:hypothetical protein
LEEDIRFVSGGKTEAWRLQTTQSKRKERKPNVAIESDIFNDSKSKAEKWHLPHVTYVEGAIDYFNKNEDFLEKFNPFISRTVQNPHLLGPDRRSLFLKDSRAPGKVFEICIVPHPDDSKKLAVICMTEFSFDCEHAKFALRLPELVHIEVSEPADDYTLKRLQEALNPEVISPEKAMNELQNKIKEIDNELQKLKTSVKS